MTHISKVAVASALLLSGIAAAPAAQAADDEVDLDIGLDVVDGEVTLDGICLEVGADAADVSAVSLPAIPALPSLPDVDTGIGADLEAAGLDQDVDVPAIELSNIDEVVTLVVVLTDGTVHTVTDTLSDGVDANVDTPAGEAVASAYLDLDATDLDINVGLCDDDGSNGDSGSDDSDSDGNGGSNGNGAPAAQPVSGSPSFTG